jgi:hypothetical protein
MVAVRPREASEGERDVTVGVEFASAVNVNPTTGTSFTTKSNEVGKAGLLASPQ